MAFAELACRRYLCHTFKDRSREKRQDEKRRTADQPVSGKAIRRLDILATQRMSATMQTKKPSIHIEGFQFLAETEGFEPSIQV